MNNLHEGMLICPRFCIVSVSASTFHLQEEIISVKVMLLLSEVVHWPL